MNLVAKEFINPLNLDAFASGIPTAIEAGRDQRRRRAHRLRLQTRQATNFDRLDRILSRSAAIMEEQAQGSVR